MIFFVFNRDENSGKRRKCWFTAFSPFPQCFQKALRKSSETLENIHPLNGAFHIISVISQRQLTFLMGSISTRPGVYKLQVKTLANGTKCIL